MPFTVSLSTRDTSCVLESQHTPILGNQDNESRLGHCNDRAGRYYRLYRAFTECTFLPTRPLGR